MSNTNLCIILPMYNEELSIPGLKDMFAGELSLPEGWKYQLLVVNDGSTDNTLELVKQWASDFNGQFHIVNHKQNRGLGEAILTGFIEAQNIGVDCVLTMDADVSHPVRTIAQLAKAIDNGADIAIASRFAPGGRQYGVSWKRRMFSLGARLVLLCCFPLKGVRDYTVSFRVYRMCIIEEALRRSNGHLLQLKSFACAAELLLKTATLAKKIKEVPLVLHYEEKKSSSKLRVKQTIKDYIRLTRLPKIKCTLGRGLLISDNN